MRHMFSYACLLLLVICCWHCTARHIGGKKKGSDESSASHEHESHSLKDKLHSAKDKLHSAKDKLHSVKDKLHAHEHESHSHEHGSHSHEHGSSSDEDSSSKEKKASCTDRKKNNGETDIDCGGKKCAKCDDSKICKDDGDCKSGSCKKKRCAERPTTTTEKPKTKTPKTTSPSTTKTHRTTTLPTTSTSPKIVTTTVSETTTTAAPETEEATTAAPEIESTTAAAPETEEATTAQPEIESTTAAAPETEEATTAAPEIESTTAAAPETEEATTAAPEIESTTAAAPETEEATTVAPEIESTTAAAPETEEATTAAPETEEAAGAALEIKVTTTTSPTCDFDCENGGTCTGYNECTCTTGFSGQTCEVQSVGLCLNNETFEAEPLLLITFGNGSAQYSSATPASFNFRTTYHQGFQPVTNDGTFSFINSVHDDFGGAWHTGATDHSEDNNGYMYLVNADFNPGQFYDGIVDNLCIGLRYEFSVYLANLCKSNNNIKPNVLFQVRSVDDNALLAELASGDVDAHDKLTWQKYGFSFIATSRSVNLLMISNAPGGGGNDLVIDDIALRVCAHRGAGFCPSQ